MARKYPKVQGWWVYVIQVPSIGKFYIGVSKRQCCQRWQKSNYEGIALEPYLDEWDSMIKTVIQDNLTKEEALQLEDALIQCLDRYNLCLNELRSGLICVSDRNAYARERHKQRYENDAEYREHQKQRKKQYELDNKEKIQEQKKQYYENNKEKIREYRKQYYQRKKLEQQHTSLL